MEHAVSEAILDMKLGLAMEEGDTGEYSEEKQIISKSADYLVRILYTKSFDRDIDVLKNNPDMKKRLLEVIGRLREVESTIFCL